MSYAQWNPSTTYAVNDVVEYAGLVYRATVANITVPPQPTTATWLFIGSTSGGGVSTITAGNTNITLGGTPSNVVVSGTLTTLTGNVAGNNRYISGMYAPPFGTSAIVCAGTDTFLIEDTVNVPLFAVANTGLILGGGGTATTVPVQAPTVVPSTDSSTKVATTAFVQSALSGATTPSLSTVLTTGNSAGSTAINMNSQNITAVNNLTVASPYNFSIISIYADATARDAALPTPYTGQFAFLTGTNKLQYYNGGWGNINASPITASISGFTLGVNYEIIYVNSANTVVGSAVNGGFTIIRFYPTSTTTGSITLTGTVPITYLLVGGGGGGGGAIAAQCNGGGGGGGGYLSTTDNMNGGVSYALQVGGGGAGGSVGSGTAGTLSSLAVVSGTITANGGGAGGSSAVGGNGGSGGGGSASNVASPFAGGIGSQGNNGGSGVIAPPSYSGGGGGNTGNGAGGGVRGNGGAGTANTITGASVFYAGGGGGGSNDVSTNPAPGGSGGGGRGGAGVPASTYTLAIAGTDGLGGGGGGGGQGDSSNVGFKGGAGVVIVRFASFI